MVNKRQRRQKAMWRDEIGSLDEVTWNRQATDKDEWRRLREVFVLKWTHRE